MNLITNVDDMIKYDLLRHFMNQMPFMYFWGSIDYIDPISLSVLYLSVHGYDCSEFISSIRITFIHY